MWPRTDQRISSSWYQWLIRTKKIKNYGQSVFSGIAHWDQSKYVLLSCKVANLGIWDPYIPCYLRRLITVHRTTPTYTLIPPCLSFHFSWFQLPVANCGLKWVTLLMTGHQNVNCSLTLYHKAYVIHLSLSHHISILSFHVITRRVSIEQ